MDVSYGEALARVVSIGGPVLTALLTLWRKFGPVVKAVPVSEAGGRRLKVEHHFSISWELDEPRRRKLPKKDL
jgi:hypothetical protein